MPDKPPPREPEPKTTKQNSGEWLGLRYPVEKGLAEKLIKELRKDLQEPDPTGDGYKRIRRILFDNTENPRDMTNPNKAPFLAYNDSVGHRTVGRGFDMSRKLNPKTGAEGSRKEWDKAFALSKVKPDFDKVYNKESVITADQMETLYIYSISTREKELQGLYKENWEKLSPHERLALESIFYNGGYGLVGSKTQFYKNMTAYLESGGSFEYQVKLLSSEVIKCNKKEQAEFLQEFRKLPGKTNQLDKNISKESLAAAICNKCKTVDDVRELLSGLSEDNSLRNHDIKTGNIENLNNALWEVVCNSDTSSDHILASRRYKEGLMLAPSDQETNLLNLKAPEYRNKFHPPEKVATEPSPKTTSIEHLTGIMQVCYEQIEGFIKSHLTDTLFPVNVEDGSWVSPPPRVLPENPSAKPIPPAPTLPRGR